LSAAYVAANIAGLAASGSVTSIALSDPADPVVVTLAQYDASLFKKVAGGFTVDVTNVNGVNGLSSVAYAFAGGNLIGTDEFFTGLTGAYTGYETDYNGGGQLTRFAFTGVTGAGYSSYEYDYVGGVFAGAKFDVTSPPAGAGFSSYVVDYSAANAFAGEQFFYTGVTATFYTSEELDLDSSGNLSRVILSGVQGEPYSSLEYDYAAGAYEGVKVFYTGVTGQSFTAQEVDVSALGQLTKVVYSGMTATPYSSLEQDFVKGALSDVIYSFTNVTGQAYYAYQQEFDALGNALQETVDYNSGVHSINAQASGQTLESLGNDLLTGSGATTFVLNGIYGKDAIENFAAGDTISLAATEYAQLASVIQNAGYSGGSATLSFGDGDVLVLANMTKATLTGLTGNFTSHT
jgi:hypothetical protein